MIRTARQMIPKCQTLADYLARQEAFCRARGFATSEADEPLVAYVNHGRWVGDCVCAAGIALDPAWPVAACFGCGARYSRVVFPDDREAIERILARRPGTNRNWRPHETADVLRAENLEHGVGRES